MFHTFDGGSTELEYLHLLGALAYACKPSLILETGTGRGFGTLVLAHAVRANGFGHIVTLEHHDSVRQDAESRLVEFDQTLRNFVSYIAGNTMEYLRAYEGDQFDFVFLDSDVQVRHEELKVLRERDLLSPNSLCCVHDTSRLRSRTSGDSNEAMIRALDEISQAGQWVEFNLSRGFRILRPNR